LTFSVATGSSFRVPTFNDLYWLPGGNPNLDPERSNFSKLSAHFSYSNSSFEIYTKSNASKDLIVWTSSGDFWQPENVDESFRQIIGMKVQFNVTKGLTFHGALSHIKSKHLSTGDPLRYSPKWIGNFSSQIQRWNWMLDLSLHMTGKQIIMYDFPKDLEMDPILTSHLAVTSPSIFRDQLNFMIHISNLFNQEIMTIYGYPESSRVIRLNISYRINTKDTK